MQLYSTIMFLIWLYCSHNISYKKIKITTWYSEEELQLKSELHHPLDLPCHTPFCACRPNSVRFSHVHDESPKFQKCTLKKNRLWQTVLDKNTAFPPASQMHSTSTNSMYTIEKQNRFCSYVYSQVGSSYRLMKSKCAPCSLNQNLMLWFV